MLHSDASQDSDKPSTRKSNRETIDKTQERENKSGALIEDDFDDGSVKGLPLIIPNAQEFDLPFACDRCRVEDSSSQGEEPILSRRMVMVVMRRWKRVMKSEWAR